KNATARSAPRRFGSALAWPPAMSNGFAITPAAPLFEAVWDPRSALQYPDHAACKAKSFGHNSDDVVEQRVAKNRICVFDSFVVLDLELIEDAGQSGLNRGASHPPAHQAHFANRRVRAETSDANRMSVVQFDEDIYSAIENEMHGIRGLTLAGDDRARRNLHSLAVLSHHHGIL